jgi:purine-nucleoside phosphorylase
LETSGIPGQDGVLRIIEAKGRHWAIWIGRRHFYQGFSCDEIGYYIGVSRSLGADRLICINAAGGLDPGLNVGDLVLIEKFRSFIPCGNKKVSLDGGPWRMTSEGLRAELISVAGKCGFRLTNGTYVGVPGPTYETEADTSWLRSLGCTVVGMSTTPELEVALGYGMQTVALSVVANVHGKIGTLTHDEVVKNSRESQTSLERLIGEFLGS